MFYHLFSGPTEPVEISLIETVCHNRKRGQYLWLILYKIFWYCVLKDIPHSHLTNVL